MTVLFADLEGFTPLVEKLGPEEAYSIMDQVYEILIHKVHDYEGTINEMTGDGIKAMWNPDKESIENCIEYGKKFATSILD